MMYRVLVVEDEPLVSTINRSYAEQVEGFEVVGEILTTDGLVAAVERERPDLILLDVYFPQSSGLKALRTVRQVNWPVDVIFITAAQDPATIQEALRLGAVDYLIKPFLLDRFRQALLAFRRRREQLAAKPRIGQSEVDAALVLPHQLRLPLPKGLSAWTLQKIIDCLREAPGCLAAEEIAQRTQVSRVTAWRYLDYLAGQNRVGVSMEHGSAGRPLQKYHLIG